jgi:hypothetical protein
MSEADKEEKSRLIQKGDSEGDVEHGWPQPKWQIEALELFLEPGSYLAGLALFLIPYDTVSQGKESTLHQIQGLCATVSTFFYLAFAIIMISIRVRSLKAGHDDLQVKGAVMTAFFLFSLSLFSFCLAFLLYYADYTDEKESAFWIANAVAFLLVVASYVTMCCHYFAGTQRIEDPHHPVIIHPPSGENSPLAFS